MSVNVKKNGLVVKLGGLYAQMVARLSDLSDAQISSPSNGQVLTYDNTISKWKNQTLPEVVTTLSALSDTSISSPVSGDGLVYNGTNWVNEKLNYYLEETATLSTSTTTTYTFTNSAITTSSVIDVYSSIFGVNPSSVTVSTGTCTVVFPQYTSATSMTCRIYIK